MARPERRCLVLADGWYEWLKAEKKGAERIPFRYTIDGGEPFAFAGLWGRRRIGSASSCTRRSSSPAAANAVAAPVHDRMPCVLAGPEEEAAWLAGESEGLLVPLAGRAHHGRRREPRGQQGRGRGPELLTPPEPTEPAQLSLDT